MPRDDSSILERDEQKLHTEEPPLYKVFLHNDDYTTMDFVVELLVQIFNKSPIEAQEIMLRIHNDGIGECGIFIKEIAETKVAQVHVRASDAGFPLKASMEKA